MPTVFPGDSRIPKKWTAKFARGQRVKYKGKDAVVSHGVYGLVTPDDKQGGTTVTYFVKVGNDDIGGVEEDELTSLEGPSGTV